MYPYGNTTRGQGMALVCQLPDTCVVTVARVYASAVLRMPRYIARAEILAARHHTPRTHTHNL